VDGDSTLDDAPDLQVTDAASAAGAAAPEPDPAPDPEPDQRHEQHQGHEPAPPATGDPAVDEATADVAATAGETLETRLAAYERAHRTLQDRLADVEG
jgi:hypothetical protein